MKKTGLIAIAGVVGVGKTTLAAGLVRELGGELILEEYDQNPFLADEFGGDADAALPCELFFLLSRIRQLRQKKDPKKPTVCDYIFEKNRIFAEFYLKNEEFAVYDTVENSVKRLITEPQTIIYLHDTTENCLERVRRRGRDFEKGITAEWLRQLERAYERLLIKWQNCPVVRIDCSRYDVRQRETARLIGQKLTTISNENTTIT